MYTEPQKTQETRRGDKRAFDACVIPRHTPRMAGDDGDDEVEVELIYDSVRKYASTRVVGARQSQPAIPIPSDRSWKSEKTDEPALLSLSLSLLPYTCIHTYIHIYTALSLSLFTWSRDTTSIGVAFHPRSQAGSTIQRVTCSLKRREDAELKKRPDETGDARGIDENDSEGGEDEREREIEIEAETEGRTTTRILKETRATRDGLEK